MKATTILRCLFSAVLLFLVYQETGGWTVLALLLLGAAAEHGACRYDARTCSSATFIATLFAADGSSSAYRSVVLMVLCPRTVCAVRRS